MTDLDLFKPISKILVDTYVTAREMAIHGSLEGETVCLYSYPSKNGPMIQNKYIVSKEQNLDEDLAHLKVKKLSTFKNGKNEQSKN